jgi:hypothetical protein
LVLELAREQELLLGLAPGQALELVVELALELVPELALESVLLLS